MEDKFIRSKKTVMIILCAAIFLMAVGFAAFSTTLTINGTANVSSDWKVVFTDIDVVSKTDGATSKTAEASGTSATFNVGLTSPGDNIVYEITVENQGTLDAIIENIVAAASKNPAIGFEISNIKIGDELAKKTSTTFNVTISYSNSVTSQPNDVSSTLTVDITYVQNLGQTITPADPEITTKKETIAQKLQNEVANAKSDVNIDFTYTSSGYRYDKSSRSMVYDASQVTNGMYYTSENTQDNKTVYYYRGIVENNYVQFGSYKKNITINGTNHVKDEPLYWRIVRINEDGSIRIMTEDKVANSIFNKEFADNAYVGYMFGEPESSGDFAYFQTHANTHDSRVKELLDDWYVNMVDLLNYSNFISITAGFCNDRSVSPTAGIWQEADTALGYGQNNTYYGSSYRLITTEEQYWSSRGNPQFACPNEAGDLFTVKSSSIGNKALEVPVGLITADELVYAGAIHFYGNEKFYLYNGNISLTMTPSRYYSGQNRAQMYALGENHLVDEDVTVSSGVRPVINIKPTATVIQGTGLSTDPYVIG